MIGRRLVLGTFCAAMIGCGSNVPEQMALETIRAEQACSLEGLSGSLRQTIIILDQASLRHSVDAVAFRAENRDVAEVIGGLAQADHAVVNGMLAPRERVSLYLAPADGSSLRLVFTGCAPALAGHERQQLEAKSGWVEDFTHSGSEDSIDTYAQAFTQGLIGATLRSAAEAPQQVPADAPDFGRSPLVRSLSATSRLGDPALGLVRVILVAPRSLRSIPSHSSVAEAREAGFTLSQQLNLNLAQTEVNVALAPSAEGRDFLQAFLLGSGANLVSWSTRAPTSLSPAPSTVKNFTGEIEYGAYRYPIEVRLASAASGALVNSWIVVRGQRLTGTPLTGTLVCGGNRCRATSDDTGFAQAWSLNPGGAPEFAADLPFGGMRQFEITINGDRGMGRAFDPAVDEVAGRRDIRFTMRRAM